MSLSSHNRSPNRTPPLGCSLDSAASYSGFSLRSYGDSNRYLELNERNIELVRRYHNSTSSVVLKNHTSMITFVGKQTTIITDLFTIFFQERKIMDLEENLREKDELIRARTQAVTLMSADLSAKGRSTLDQVSNIAS